MRVEFQRRVLSFISPGLLDSTSGLLAFLLFNGRQEVENISIVNKPQIH